MAPLPKSVEIIAEHVLTQLNNAKNRPLFVALQGPQGSGKSYTADLLAAHLSAPPHALPRRYWAWAAQGVIARAWAVRTWQRAVVSEGTEVSLEE